MALANCPACYGQQRSLRRRRQVLSWALARSPGPRSLAWDRLAAFAQVGPHEQGLLPRVQLAPG